MDKVIVRMLLGGLGVVVAGVLNVSRTEHDSGSSIYAMRADDVEPYTQPPR